MASIVTSTTLANAAPDDAKVRCQTAYEHSQQLRRDGRIAASRVELGVCVETCPPALSRDCERWLGEIASLLPTVRLRAKDVRGERLVDVRVIVDGKLVADPATDEPVTLDPGERVIRFERAGAQPLEVRVDLAPGERDHLVEVTLAPSAAIAPNASTTPDSAPVVDHRSRVPSYVLGLAGGAALLVGGALALKGLSDRSDLETECSPRCNPERVDSIRTLWWASAITAGVGAAAVGLAIVLWPRGPAVVSTGLGLGVRGDF